MSNPCKRAFVTLAFQGNMLFLALLLLLPLPVTAERVPTMSVEDLAARLSQGEVVVIDVRMEVEWQSSNQKIKGAVWEDPRYFAQWAVKYPKDKTIVLYCA